MTPVFVYGHVEWRGRRVRLSAKCLDLVHLLVERKGKTASCIEIRDAVWGRGAAVGDGDEGLRKAVASLVLRTNRGFRVVDPDFISIEPVVGGGYRWRIEGPPVWLRAGRKHV